MTGIVFYEKPGCANNARQKRALLAAGHEVEARSLLTEPWSAERLRSFFGDRPVREWFNRAAPRVRSGEIDPDALGADEAMALLLAEPLLIRRPLMEAAGRRMAGFEPALVAAWLGLPAADAVRSDLETCHRPSGKGCSPPHSKDVTRIVSADPEQPLPFARIGGQETVDAIVEAFYRRMDGLPEAAAIRSMHADDLGPTKSVLKLYLGEWLGGPRSYSAMRGHPRLRMRHMHLRIGEGERDAWMLCMRGALEEVLPQSPLREELLQALWKLADWMRNDPRTGQR